MAKRKKGISKAKRNRLHARQRAIQRLGIDIGRVDQKIIVNMIMDGKEGATFVRKDSNDRSIWQIEYKDKVFQTVYSKRQKTIITVWEVPVARDTGDS